MAEVRTEFTGDAASLAAASKKAQSGINDVLEASDKAAGSLGQLNGVMELATKAQKGMTVASAFLSTGTAAVTAAVKAQTVAFLSSPLAPVAVAVLALGSAYAYLATETSKANAKVEASAKAASAASESASQLAKIRTSLADAEALATGKVTQEELGLRDTIQEVQFFYAGKIAAQKETIKKAEAEGSATGQLIVILEGLQSQQDKLIKQAKDTVATNAAAKKATDDKAAAEKRAAAASKKRTEQEAAAAKLLSESQARIAAVSEEWDRNTDTVQGAIEAAKALTSQVMELDDTEEERIGREFAAQDTLLRKQISVNKSLGISTAGLEEARIRLKENTRDKYESLAQDEVDAQKEADAKIAQSARETVDAIASTFENVVSSFGSIVDEISSRASDALSETTNELSEIDGLLSDLNDANKDYSKETGAALVEAYTDGKIAAEELSTSQKQYLKETLAAEQDKLKKEEKAKKEAAQTAFDIAQAVAIVQAVMGTAAGIMQGFGQLGPIGGAIAAVVTGALGAVQIGLIASQKPSFAAGGFLDGASTTGTPVTMHPNEAVLNQRGRALLGDDVIRSANGGTLGGGGGNRGQIVYKHKAFEYFVADHLQMGGTLAKTIRKGDRIGQRRRGRGGNS